MVWSSELRLHLTGHEGFWYGGVLLNHLVVESSVDLHLHCLVGIGLVGFPDLKEDIYRKYLLHSHSSSFVEEQ